MQNSLLCSLLHCWYLDVNFLDNLVEENDLDLDYDDIISQYWYDTKNLNINMFIYEAFEKIKRNFFEEKWEEIKEKLEISDLDNLDYEIFTNYMDSHLWFNDEKVQEIFERYNTIESTC